MNKELQDKLMAVIREILPGAQVNEPDDKWSWRFDDTCGCYSEWTTEACSLNGSVYSESIKGLSKKKQWEIRMKIEDAVTKWAENNLTYSGCECCGENTIYVNVYLYEQESTRNQRDI